MLSRFLQWLGARRLLSLNPNERQNLTTLALMGGAMAMTVLVGVLVWIVRYSWTTELVQRLAPEILSGLFNVIYGMLAMTGIMIVTQASIALGGKVKGKFGPAELEASQNDTEENPAYVDPTP